jgi:hypothetical protein
MPLAFQRVRTPHERATPQAVFLHSAWRSAGTWIWDEFRTHPETMAFYEPLHEELAAMTLESISDTNTQSWNSGHSPTAPYFLEYAPLLGQSRRGVRGFKRSMAFDRFFVDANASNRRLFDYVTSLHHLAHTSEKMPVFKFCRSLGRTAWLQRNFPDAMHVAIVRSPLAQWESSARLAARGTPYFLAMPLAILALNASEPLVKRACEALGLRLTRLRALTFKSTFKRAEAYVKTAEPELTYRGLLAFWLATTLRCVPHVDLAIDSERLTSDADYRAHVERTLREKTGIPVDFTSARPPRSVQAGLPELRAVAALHEAALGFARAAGAPAIVEEKLRTGGRAGLFVPA